MKTPILLYDSDMKKETKVEQGRSTIMILDRNENKEVAVLLGAGSMGMAILRRVAAGKKILLGGRRGKSTLPTLPTGTSTTIPSALKSPSLRSPGIRRPSPLPLFSMPMHMVRSVPTA